MRFAIYLLCMLLVVAQAAALDGLTLPTPPPDLELRVGDLVTQNLTFVNSRSAPLHLTFGLEGNISPLVSLSQEAFDIPAGGSAQLQLSYFGDPSIANLSIQNATGLLDFQGKLLVRGDANEELPLSFHITLEAREEIGILVLQLNMLKENIIVGKKLMFTVDMTNLLSSRTYNVTLSYSLKAAGNRSMFDNGSVVHLGTDVLTIKNSATVLKAYTIPKDYREGDYLLNVDASYLTFNSSTTALFNAQRALKDKLIFGFLPVWLVFTIVCVGAVTLLIVILVRKNLEAKKRFHAKIDYKLLPQAGDRSLFVGQLAETTHDTYIDMDVLTVHTIVAGSTGGGKSIAAQVIIEECLLKNCAIVVFDPTAQWSGMLRKCEDKKMMSFYPRYHLKPSDARAFPGNIRAIKDGREIIDIAKYVKAGEIQVFTTNTLDPKDYDMFVANTVREIFHSNLQEFRGLRTMLVYDEIHRILPKFGGSGEGFVQIERGCREFRKWGYGILLISQVLADFVGQIKANINTEVQMKTRDEGDLSRIKMKYGDEFVQGLVKAPVGSGMVQNSAWNRGLPYYVTFRPILHSVVRLTDEELDKYNKFNDVVDDLDFQFEQLEKLGQDVFDFRLELKLAKDKIRSGNFNMVQIYLDGLTPRIDKLWTKLGKKPEKLKRKLVDLSELKAEMEAARLSREKYEAELKASAGQAAAAPEAAKAEAPQDPQVLSANIAAMTELSGQLREALKIKDWGRSQELVVEIKGLNVGKDKLAERDALVETLKAEIELAKNPPPPKKPEPKAAAPGAPATPAAMPPSGGAA